MPEWKKMMNFPQSFEEGRQEYSKPVEVSRTIEKEYSEVPKVVKQETREVRTTSQKDHIITPSSIKKKTEPSLIIEPDKDTLVNGIIWSEVLGPPRALKSHRQSRQMPKR